jgi:hypothetical protein
MADVDAHEGLILKSARHLFQKVKERHAAGSGFRGRYTITASYCEVKGLWRRRRQP